MSRLSDIYRTSLSLLTDLYQVTMAYGYWKQGHAERGAVFHLFFRANPFGGGFTVAAGLQSVLEYVREFRFAPDDIQCLAGLVGNDGSPLFETDFLAYLSRLRLSVDLHAIPEGTVVFPHEPLVRVRGSLLQCQLLETVLLNLVNFPTLIATKSARICFATGGEPVLEFGLRRAQGIDGALTASRAAYIGGCTATSNVLAGKLYGIPVRGTHAHSWVMSFDDELTSFQAYARAMPNNCVFLVDTYDTLEGVRNAIRVGRALREEGHEMVGIRLDSGDLARLSIDARELLDEAGFENAMIVASNDLDERVISKLKAQGATMAVWGVGTRLVTAYDQPALGGVYKLGALQSDTGDWQPRLKLSEETIKTSTPGMLQVRRFRRSRKAIADMIFDELLGVSDGGMIVEQNAPAKHHRLEGTESSEDLLVPVVWGGEVVYESPRLETIRDRARKQLISFHEGIRHQERPQVYPVGLEPRLDELKRKLIREAREAAGIGR